MYDFPTSDQVKIYYDNASLHLNLLTGQGIYEKVSRRPVIYQANTLHLNRLQGWKWVADVFAPTKQVWEYPEGKMVDLCRHAPAVVGSMSF